MTSLLLASLFVAPAHAGGLKAKKILPPPVKDLRLGESLVDTRHRHFSMDEVEQNTDFRIVYHESFRSDPLVRSATYYFDADLPGQPLYEVILNFADPAARDALALERFGPPNHEGTEWRLPVKGADWTLAMWTHQSKLIIAAEMAGTEWESGVD